MGKVMIVKNNDKENLIYSLAKQSFDKVESRYYFAQAGTVNEDAVKKIKDKFEGDMLILLITYDSANEDKIEEVFIGSVIRIREDNKVDYVMHVHLTDEIAERTIKSIVDRIDLNISKDFQKGCYVMMSDMESLYEELKARLVAKQKTVCYNAQNANPSNVSEVYELSPLAQSDSQSFRIYSSNDAGTDRTEFQRDRERVVNCRAFRRMVDKAQIFSADKGDYYRTRMTHSLEVNQIAKAIAYALGLNLDLTEAIALGHDVGHTPFGHQGERTLDDILTGNIKVDIKSPDELFEGGYWGRFQHNYQSARMLTYLEEKYVGFPGLDVSVQVVEGVLKHTKLKIGNAALNDFLKKPYIDKITFSGKKEDVCTTLEGQTVAIADEIAQRGHDVDDALTSGLISIDEFIDRLEISKCDSLKKEIEGEMKQIEDADRVIVNKQELKIARIVSCIIHYLIDATIEASGSKMASRPDITEITMENTEKFVDFSDEVKGVNSYLERVVSKKVICNNEVARADYNASMIVKTLFEKYYANPRLLHEGTLHKMFVETLNHENERVADSAVNLNDGDIKLVNEEIKEMTQETIDFEKIKSYLENGETTGIEEDIVIFEKRKILIRCIVDFIAGMTDSYALTEYEHLK